MSYPGYQEGGPVEDDPYARFKDDEKVEEKPVPVGGMVPVEEMAPVEEDDPYARFKGPEDVQAKMVPVVEDDDPYSRFKDPLLVSTSTQAGGVQYTPPGASAISQKRGNLYGPMIAEQARKFKVPAAWYLAQIYTESRYNPDAISSADAVGIAQFIIPTAKEMGLRVDATLNKKTKKWELKPGGIDERRDPKKAIPASLRYMRKQYDRAKKFWPKMSETEHWLAALSAYNSGWAATRRNMEKSGSFYHKNNLETQAYLSRIPKVAKQLKTSDKLEKVKVYTAVLTPEIEKETDKATGIDKVHEFIDGTSVVLGEYSPEDKQGTAEWQEKYFEEQQFYKQFQSKVFDFSRNTLRLVEANPTGEKASVILGLLTGPKRHLLRAASHVTHMMKDEQQVFSKAIRSVAVLRMIMEDADAPEETKREAIQLYVNTVDLLMAHEKTWKDANRKKLNAEGIYDRPEDMPLPEKGSGLVGTGGLSEALSRGPVEGLDELRLEQQKTDAEASADRQREDLEKQRQLLKEHPGWQLVKDPLIPSVPDTLWTMVDLVDLPIKGIMQFLMGNFPTERSALDDTPAQKIKDWSKFKLFDPSAAPGHGRIGGGELDWEARHKYIKDKAKEGSVAALGIMAVGGAIGKMAGPALGGIHLIGELWWDSMERERDFRERNKMSVFQATMLNAKGIRISPQAKKDLKYLEEGPWPTSPEEAVQTIANWEEGIGQLTVDVLLDPLTWSSGGVEGVKAFDKKMSRILNKKYPVYKEIEGVRKQIGTRKLPKYQQEILKEEISSRRAQIAQTGMVEPEPLKMGMAIEKKGDLIWKKMGLKNWEDIKKFKSRMNKMDPTSDEYIKAVERATGRNAEELEKLQKRVEELRLRNLNEFGIEPKLKRAEADLNKHLYIRNSLLGKTETALHSQQAYRDITRLVDDLPGFESWVAESKTQASKSVLTKDLRWKRVNGGTGEYVRQEYMDIVKWGRENGIPIDAIRKEFGRGGVDLYRGEASLFGITSGSFGATHPLRRLRRRMQPKFAKKELDIAIGLKPSGRFFTQRSGRLDKAARALHSNLEKKGQRSMEILLDAFMDPQTYSDPKRLKWFEEHHLDPDKALRPADGINPVFSRSDLHAEERLILEQLETSTYTHKELKERAYGDAMKRIRKIRSHPLYKGQEELYGPPATPTTIGGKKVQGPQYGGQPIIEPPARQTAIFDSAGKVKGLSKGEGRYGYDLQGQPSNIIKEETLMGFTRDRTITRIGLTADDLKIPDEGEIISNQILYTFTQEKSDMRAAINTLKKIAKDRGIVLEANHEFHIDTALRSGEEGVGIPRGVREDVLLSHSYEKQDLISMGIAKLVQDELGNMVIASKDPNALFPPTIAKDSKGTWYAVEYRPTGEEGLYTLSKKDREFLVEYKKLMQTYRDEGVRYGLLDEMQEGYNPLNGQYYPRHLARSADDYAGETLEHLDIYQGVSGDPTKGRTEKFGVWIGDKKYEAQKDLIETMSAYNKGFALKTARHQFELAAADVYGLRKEQFMELYTLQANGRGVNRIVNDPHLGTRFYFDKSIPKEILVHDDIFPDVHVDIIVGTTTKEQRKNKLHRARSFNRTVKETPPKEFEELPELTQDLGRLPLRKKLWDDIAYGERGNNPYPADFVAADQKHEAWLRANKATRGKRPVYEGGELDSINEWLGLTGDKRVSGLRHGFTRLIRGIKTWDELMESNVLDILRDVPGLEKIRWPEYMMAKKNRFEEMLHWREMEDAARYKAYLASPESKVQRVFETPATFEVGKRPGDAGLHIDQDAIAKNWEKKPWLDPAIEGVHPLADDFASPGDWLDFVVAQELAMIKKPWGTMDRQRSSLVDYINEINNTAMVELERVRDARFKKAQELKTHTYTSAELNDMGGVYNELKTARMANDEWMKLENDARHANGTARKGAKWKLIDNLSGDQVLIPAEQANMAARLGKDENMLTDSAAFKRMMARPDNLGRALRGVRSAVVAFDKAHKQGLLIPSPAFHVINWATDSMMLMAHLGIYDQSKAFAKARKLSKDPSSISFSVKNRRTKIDGITMLKEARRLEIGTNGIARLDYLTEGKSALEALQLAALRSNGKAVDYSFWYNLIKGESVEMAWRKSLPGRVSRREVGFKKLEVHAAAWTDEVQLTGFIHEVESGASFADAARRVHGAVIDYGDKPRWLNFIRLFWPFATWQMRAPAAGVKALAKRPLVTMIPVKIGQEIESIAVKEDGPNYYLPEWMQEMANYRRVPRAFRRAVELGRKLGGGTELDADEQVYIRERIVPLFEAVSPFLATAQKLARGDEWGFDPLVAQLGPAWRLLYEWGAKRNLYNKNPEYGLQFSRPFAAGTPFPRKYGVFGGPIPPSSDQKGFSMFGRTASSPQQGAWFARHMLPGAGGALPELFPGQKFLFSRPGLFLLNKLQQQLGGPGQPPVVYGPYRDHVSPDQANNLLAQMGIGLASGLTPAVVSPEKAATSAMHSRQLDQKRKEAEIAYSNMMKFLKRWELQMARDLEAEQEKKRQGATIPPGVRKKRQGMTISPGARKKRSD